nr:hypothetical protein [Tanacetum cinerariifolium]
MPAGFRVISTWGYWERVWKGFGEEKVYNETLEELTTAVIMMVRIQPADDNTMTEPTYDAKVDPNPPEGGETGEKGMSRKEGGNHL